MEDDGSAVTSPFDAFLAHAKPLLDLEREHTFRPDDAFKDAENRDRREFLEDIVGRVALLAFAYRRNVELTAEYWDRDKKLRLGEDASGVVAVPPEHQRAEDEWRAELQLLSEHAAYEATSIVTMLRSFGLQPLPHGELQFLIKARDRFLAHPSAGRVRRRGGPRGLAIPLKGFTSLPLVGLDSLEREYARAKGVLGEGWSEARIHEHWRAQRIRNEDLVRSHRRDERNERLSAEQVAALLAFGVRDPDLEQALQELAKLVVALTPTIEATADEAMHAFGYERIHVGPVKTRVRWDAFFG